MMPRSLVSISLFAAFAWALINGPATAFFKKSEAAPASAPDATTPAPDAAHGFDAP